MRKPGSASRAAGRGPWPQPVHYRFARDHPVAAGAPQRKIDVGFWNFLKIGVVAMPVALLAAMSGAILMEALPH